MKWALFPILVFIAGAIIIWFSPNDKTNTPTVADKIVEETQSYEECVDAGNPVMESHPPSCRTATGQIVTQNAGNEIVLKDKIRVDNPEPNQKVATPLTVTGKARGGWFFEADFSAKILNSDGEVIGEGIMTAQSEWMTDEFVPFEGVVEFENTDDKRGQLVLEKANPSGLSEHAESLIVPVEFN